MRHASLHSEDFSERTPAPPDTHARSHSCVGVGRGKTQPASGCRGTCYRLAFLYAATTADSLAPRRPAVAAATLSTYLSRARRFIKGGPWSEAAIQRPGRGLGTEAEFSLCDPMRVWDRKAYSCGPLSPVSRPTWNTSPLFSFEVKSTLSVALSATTRGQMLDLEERMGTQAGRDARDKAVPALFACRVRARTVVLPAVKFRASAARARPRNCPLYLSHWHCQPAS